MSEQEQVLSKKEDQKPKRDVYMGLHNSVQSFDAIGILQAVDGNIVLRGRNGQRDKIFRLEDAVEKYNDTMALVRRYALYGVRGWDELAEIAEDFKVRIKEAAEQRIKMHLPVPESAKVFLEIMSNTKA